MEVILAAVKEALNISSETTEFDNVLTQKINIVKAFLYNAGVLDDILATDEGIGVIAQGVGEIWDSNKSAKFSSAFQVLANQLALRD